MLLSTRTRHLASNFSSIFSLVGLFLNWSSRRWIYRTRNSRQQFIQYTACAMLPLIQPQKTHPAAGSSLLFFKTSVPPFCCSLFFIYRRRSPSPHIYRKQSNQSLYSIFTKYLHKPSAEARKLEKVTPSFHSKQQPSTPF